MPVLRVIVKRWSTQERHSMQLQLEIELIEASVQSKLAKIGSELAITDAQESAWASFVETTDEIAMTLEAIGNRIAKQYSDRAPLVSETLDVQVDALATCLKFAQILRGKVRELLQALMPEQRRRADRLLQKICDELCIPNRMIN